MPETGDKYFDSSSALGKEQAQCFLNGKPSMYSPEKIPFSFLKATLQKWLQILYMVPQAIQIALLERFLKQIVFTV